MPRLPTIAIGTASVAVLLSLIALVVVSTRAPNHSEEVGIVPFETPTAAADVMRLRETVELAKDESGAIGVRVIDEQLRALLGLQIADVIAGINGTPIKRERDVAEALSGARLANAMSLYIDVIREGEPVVLRWKLDETLRQARASRDLPSAPSVPSDPFATQLGGTSDPIVDQITKVDDFHYVVPRTVVDQILANPMAMARGARIVPAMSMGKTEGFKLYAIRPTSVYAKLGFSNGDLVREINGFTLDGPDKMLEIYTKLRDATSLEIALTRRGRDASLRIEIR